MSRPRQTGLGLRSGSVEIDAVDMAALAVLLAVTMAAALNPALRATRADPMEALRG